MNRRELLAAVAVVGMIPGARAFAAAGDLKSAAREAWLYGLPWIEMAAARDRMLGNKGGQPAGLNAFGHSRQLIGPEGLTITSPNNDTIYSSAWLDLTQGPLTLTVPPTGDRYISLAGMNMYTDNDFVLGTRTTGGAGGRYTIVGPGQAGAGPNIVRLNTAHGWLLARTLVDGPQDLPAVHKIQDQLRLSGPAGVRPAKVYATRHSPALEYFASLAELLKFDPPPATDGVLFGRAAPLGLSAGGGFDPRRFDAAAVAEIEAGVAEARKAIDGIRPGASVQGWTYPRHTLGYFHQDYLFRAAVAVIGLAALPPAEAMYMQPVADKGRIFDGTGPYRMHFPAGQMPPVNAFWSLTMYRPTKDGQFFLVDNPIKRYSIGDRTPGLRKNADGSLDLWIARSDPGGDMSANWLPAPSDGPFSLSFRAYLPTPDFQDGRYRLPALQQV
ncbi:MAG: DUF1254 domain-containing protein [Phenylobacterium sp.]|uniref:DUF1254 domain-containing protein n=1 Tax=Phenylobacterium sp. TaxID=1871053 RepID=UPI001A1B2F5F|nr:DUF1254 domain-containing protein [Phenylobacterium sp.]MBJ7412386.1 DUF1254 domain-containing protein [Phenylobacterium sp.]